MITIGIQFIIIEEMNKINGNAKSNTSDCKQFCKYDDGIGLLIR